MATFIALDTSTEACSVTLVKGTWRSTLSSDTPQYHAQQLLPFVDQLLEQSSLGIRQLDFIACSQGPGSFTGLRIGLGVAQGLAYGAALPMVGVCSLAALAQRATRSQGASATRVCTLLDARMGEIYWAEYIHTDGNPTAVVLPTLSTPEIVAAYIRQQLQSVSILNLVGSGLPLLHLTVDETRHSIVDAQLRPDSEAVADIAELMWEQGAAVAPDAFELLYLRNSVSWNKRQRIRTLPTV